MITLIIISLIFATLSGFCKAIMDLSEQSDLKFTPTVFWIKNQSWKNKWKGGLRKNGEKFWGSSRWFVALTDGWHLFGILFRVTFLTSFLCVGMLTCFSTWFYFGVLTNYVLFATSFHLFYNSKLLRK